MSLVSRCALLRVGARHDQRWHAQHVRRQPGRHQFLDRLCRRHQDFAAQMSALLGRRKLIFKVNARRARFDHGFHQLERVQVPAKPCFRVGNQRSKPVALHSSLRRDGSGPRG